MLILYVLIAFLLIHGCSFATLTYWHLRDGDDLWISALPPAILSLVGAGVFVSCLGE